MLKWRFFRIYRNFIWNRYYGQQQHQTAILFKPIYSLDVLWCPVVSSASRLSDHLLHDHLCQAAFLRNVKCIGQTYAFWHILHNSGEAVVHPRLKYYDCVARRYRLRFGTVHQCANFYAFHKSWRGLTSPFPQPPSTGLSSKRCPKSVAWAAVTVRLGICAQATWLWLLQCSRCWGRFETSYFTFSSVCVFSVIMKWWMARSFNF